MGVLAWGLVAPRAACACHGVRGRADGVVTKRGVRESWGVQRLFVVVALISSGCLAEYVLPGGSRGDTEATGDTMVSGDVPTVGTETGKGTQGDSEGGCESECDGECTAGTSRCGEQCVDRQTDEQHCGSCDEVCKVDEMCVVGECRDVVVLECASCPCADQCPPGSGDGLLETTSGGDGGDSDTADSGGKDPQQGLCCELAEAMQVICVIGDIGETLVCP